MRRKPVYYSPLGAILAALTTSSRRKQLACYPAVLAVFCAVLFSAAAQAAVLVPPAVWTEHNDNGRTGQNLVESILTPSNVNQTQFGKIFSYNIDDQSYGQPLYMPNLTMSVDNTSHNVVFVTTVNDSVYAFDADSGAANGGKPLWKVSLEPAGARPPNVSDADSEGACGGAYTDFTGQYGIVGTPVIDTTTDTLYVVARTVEAGAFIQRLHALSLTSGTEKFGGPVVISGSYGGVNFDPMLNNQRPALALVNGNVYIAWSSHCDNGAYHGFLMGYSASTLQQTSIWSSTNSNGGQGGIWQGGQGVTSDGVNVYLMTGNGTWDGSGNFGESFVKLNSALSVLDYFTPSNYNSLNGGDTDLGSAGCLGIPGTSLVFGGGKQGMVYLVNTGNMGHENSTDNVVQEFQATFPQNGGTGHIHGGPVYFDSANGQFIYLWGENDYLHVFQFNNGTINSTPVANSTMLAPMSNVGMPGGFLSISANGNQDGIVWAYTPYNGDANHGTVEGILHAFDAVNFTGTTLNELWDTQQNATRDGLGNFAKFTYPTIANGKVYISTFGSTSTGSGQLVAYGETPGQVTPTPVISPTTGTVPLQVSITDSNASATIFYTLDGAVPTPGNSDTFQYSAPFNVTACATVTAMALVEQAGWLQSATTSVSYTMTGTAGSGTGLTGTYYNDMTLTGSSIQRVDPTINFVWPSSNTSPMAGIGPDQWSCAWTGYIQPEFTGTYTFTTVSDDGCRLWVNNQELVNDWVDQSPTAESGTINLTAGQMYPITMDYYQDGGGAQAQLYWQSGCQGYQIVPATQLYPSVAQVSIPSISPSSGSYTGGIPVTITDSTPNASIYYTTNDTAPTTSSTLYQGGFTVQPGTIVEAIATAAGALQSSVASVTYTGALPYPWQDIDIGSVGFAGSASWASGVFSQTGSGTDIWNNADAFNFIYQPLNGNGTITARVVTLGDSDPWSKGGVMVRATLTAGSTQGVTAVTPGNGVVFQDRETTGAASNSWSGADITAPYWVRVQRTGNTVIGSSSPDGINWTTIETDTVTLPSTVYVGMALCAHNNALINSATFDNVSISYGTTTSTPSISPAPGQYVSSVPVTITDGTSGAPIYYTTDGSTPSPGAGTTQLYGSQFTLTAGATVNAIAVSSGNGPSALATAAYTVQPATPIISPAPGQYVISVPVTITDVTSGSSIYYTTDGSTPSPGVGTTKLYGGQFSLTASATVNAIATASGDVPSALATSAYTVVDPATHFSVTAPSSTIAGSTFSFQVTALDQNNNVAKSYTGTVQFTSTDGSATMPAASTLANGVGTFSVALKKGGEETITATDTVTASITGTSNQIDVVAASASHFTFSVPGTAKAGTPVNITVYAKDPYNNTATSYAGTIAFSSSDTLAVLPANSTLTSGVGAFSMTFKTSGKQTVTATDKVNASITGTSNTVTVSALAATHFTVSTPSTATDGTPISITVTALDLYGNVATAYAGTVHFTSTDGAATLPANSTLTSGVGTFSVTLQTGGSQTITATDAANSSITGTSAPISVAGAITASLVVSAPSSATAGSAFNVTVKAVDINGNLVPGYTGIVHFKSTDSTAVLPANAKLTNGVGAFSITLKRSGAQTVTATDTVTATITGTSAAITVNPSAATHFTFSVPGTAKSGTAINVTVYAKDAYNNTVTGYTGTVAFTSTDPLAVLPTSSKLTSGTGVFSVTFKTDGSQSVTATDTVTPSVTGTTNGVTVSG